MLKAETLNLNTKTSKPPSPSSPQLLQIFVVSIDLVISRLLTLRASRPCRPLPRTPLIRLRHSLTLRAMVHLARFPAARLSRIWKLRYRSLPLLLWT